VEKVAALAWIRRPDSRGIDGQNQWNRQLYYERGSIDGNLDLQIDIYKDAEDGPYEVSVAQEKGWKERVID